MSWITNTNGKQNIQVKIEPTIILPSTNSDSPSIREDHKSKLKIASQNF
jgi:hypothetical protein